MSLKGKISNELRIGRVPIEESRGLETNTVHYHLYMSSLVAQRLNHVPALQEIWVRSLGQEDHLYAESKKYDKLVNIIIIKKSRLTDTKNKLLVSSDGGRGY